MGQEAARSVRLGESCRVSPEDLSRELSLADVLELSLCNNPTTRMAWLNAKTSAARHDASLSSYFPRVSASVDYGRSLIHDSGGFSAGANASWLLWDFGGREARVEQTYQAMQTAEFGYDATLQSAAYSAIAAYYKTLSSQESLASARANEETTNKALELASKKFELGLASKADKLQAETAFVQAQLESTRVEQALTNSRAALAKQLGLPPNLPLMLAAAQEGEGAAALPRPVEELIEGAKARHPRMKAEMAALKSAEAAVSEARAGFAPSISAMASTNWALSSDKSDPAHNYPYETERRVGFSLNVPIFSGFETIYSVDAAKYAYAAQAEKFRDLVQTLELEVVSAHNDYTIGLKSLELAKKMLASAKENEAVALGSYQAGRGDILRLMDAQSKLREAEQSLISARYDLAIYKLALLRATGELHTQNIEGLAAPAGAAGP